MDSLPLLFWPKSGDVLGVLIYHRVLPVAEPLRPWDIHAERFDAHVGWLARRFDILPLVDAVKSLRRGTLRRRTLCITFDDGYADNFTVAKPILDRHGAPATVFVATDYLDGGRMFNDSVVEVIARTRIESLDLREAEIGLLPVYDARSKLAAIDAILRKAKYMSPESRAKFVAELIDIAGNPRLPSDLMLTTQQLRELGTGDIAIGGHTAAHAILTTMTVQEARNQIVSGKHAIEKALGRQITAFAYPNGRPQLDYRAEHLDVVREAGFEVAVTTAHGVANPQSDPYQIPRFTPWADRRWRFAAQLTRNARLGAPGKLCEAVVA